uniref:ATP cone domain-containing protein n=1 Tax=Bacteroides fragilis TaxID=817 RepID=UPI0005CE31D1
VEEVENFVGKDTANRSVEQIQDKVEQSLMEHGFYAEAKNYILYRWQRTERRKALNSIINELQLASKMRYLSCQFTAYLTDELWLKNATHANAMAKRLADALEQVPGVRFTQRVESNQLFLTMPRAETDRMLQTYFFYFWNEEADEIRLVTSFDTTEEDIDTFIRILKK